MKYKQIRHYLLRLSALLVFCTFPILANGQQIAFPGAEGFGKYASGGRNGEVIKVTNLNDDGPGSLRSAIDKNYPRIIIFEVSGTIYLKRQLEIRHGDVTIAGQTAPGDGITLAHYNFGVEADNVIVRYIRSRLSAAAGQQDDAFSCMYSENVIIDHCSFSWSVDEVASHYFNRKLTMQNCIISESFHNSIHEKGNHGYGGIWGGDSVSYHHNLFIHNTSRNPRFQGARGTEAWTENVDFRNNVIYNWTSNSIYGGEPSEIDGSPANYNIVANYFKYGPSTASSIRDRIVEPYRNAKGYGMYYIDSNFVYEYPETSADNWQYGVQAVPDEDKAGMRSETPFPYDVTTWHNAIEAYDHVLANVGSNIPRRDTIDERLVWEVANDTALLGGSVGANKGIVDNLEDVGGYPLLFSYWPPVDSDLDGMSDIWEMENGLNKDDSSDATTIMSSGYTAIEAYINAIEPSTSSFLYPPSDLYAELTDIKEISLSWVDNSSDETAFTIWRSEGGDFILIDTVDAGQVSYQDTSLLLDMTYTYRIQARSENDSSVYSKTSSVETLGSDSKPKPAENPLPANNSNYITILPNLSWEAGVGATSHDLYFGTVNPPPFIANMDVTAFNPGQIDHNKRYYWRIDEVNASGTTTGQVWTFYSKDEIEKNLLAHFSFNSSPSVNDVSGNGITGSAININSQNFVDGIIGKALFLNGNDQYCSYPHNEKVNFDINSFSISFWINQDLATVNKSHSHRYIVKGSNIQDELSGNSGKRYEVYYTPEKNIFRFAVDDNVNKSEVSASEQLFLKSDWVHVVAVRDTLDKLVKLYANKELVGQVPDVTGDISQNENLYLSYCVDEVGYVDGGVDEYQLYGYALSQHQIDSLYGIGRVGTGTILAGPDLLIYPNPSEGLLNIELNNSVPGDIHIRVMDIIGRCCLTKSVRNSSDQDKFELSLDLSSITEGNSGIFFLHFSTPRGSVTRKIIIK